jgi:hypothetical protein
MPDTQRAGERERERERDLEREREFSRINGLYREKVCFRSFNPKVQKPTPKYA